VGGLGYTVYKIITRNTNISTSTPTQEAQITIANMREEANAFNIETNKFIDHIEKEFYIVQPETVEKFTDFKVMNKVYLDSANENLDLLQNLLSTTNNSGYVFLGLVIGISIIHYFAK
jgi:hypothetical protein